MQGIVRNNPCPGLVGSGILGNCSMHCSTSCIPAVVLRSTSSILGLVSAGRVPVQDQHDDGGVGAGKMLLPAVWVAAHPQVASLGDAGGRSAVAAVPVPGMPVGDGTRIGEHRTGLGIQQRTRVAQLAKTRTAGNHPRQCGLVGKQIQREVGDLGAHAEQYGGAAIESPGAQRRR